MVEKSTVPARVGVGAAPDAEATDAEPGWLTGVVRAPPGEAIPRVEPPASASISAVAARRRAAVRDADEVGDELASRDARMRFAPSGSSARSGPEAQERDHGREDLSGP
jgi:hypothetical protein